MRKLTWKILLIWAFASLSACEDSDSTVDTLCGDAVIVNETLYDVTTTSNYTITNVSVVDKCITIEIAASGCDGSTWQADLIHPGGIGLSDPEVALVKLNLTNNELCQAVFQRSYVFDLRTIIPDEYGTVLLNLEGWEEQLLIE